VYSIFAYVAGKVVDRIGGPKNRILPQRFSLCAFGLQFKSAVKQFKRLIDQTFNHAV
jgi:hypothetical protein